MKRRTRILLSVLSGVLLSLAWLGFPGWTLFIAFLPRTLFELKNGFEQTKILLNFFIKPKLYNPKPFYYILVKRVQLFFDYWRGIFPNDYWCFFFSIILLFLVLLLFPPILVLMPRSLKLYSICNVLLTLKSIYRLYEPCVPIFLVIRELMVGHKILAYYEQEDYQTSLSLFFTNFL